MFLLDRSPIANHSFLCTLPKVSQKSNRSLAMFLCRQSTHKKEQMEINVVRNHKQRSVTPTAQRAVLARPMEDAGLGPLSHHRGSYRCLLEQREPLRLLGHGTTTTARALHSARRCTMCRAFTGGGKKTRKRDPPLAGIFETSCAKSSSPADPGSSILDQKRELPPPLSPPSLSPPPRGMPTSRTP